MPAYRRAAGAPQAIRDGTAAAMAFLAAEPDLARVLLLVSPGAGEQARAERERILSDCEALLREACGGSPGDHAVVAEACVGALFELLAAEVRRTGPERLQEIAPLATYLTLAPLLGAEEAAVVARGRP